VEKIRIKSEVTADLDQRNVLEKIANRIQNADNTDRDFGLAVIDLISLFGLPDTIVLRQN
jgi:2-oxo-4-hydroxy-4-carboxy--5-ureidoimidazoline (OHCU) decarboxylase